MKERRLNTFAELGLAEPIVKALTEADHTVPTPIQAQAVPLVLAGHDLIGIAQTGTGKTAAFALPILHHLVTQRRRPERRSARVLVLSPTRELSGQILESFRLYGRHVRPSTALAIGGVPLGRQARSLAGGVDVLVATPGRLVDLVENGAVRLDMIEVFVLDEADQMLDMGFIHAIRAIVAKLPAKRRNLFFSATMPKEIEKLADQLLTDPVRVAVTPVAKTADKIEQKVIFTDRAGKPNLLVEVLSGEGLDRALVFSRTKHGADRVVKGLAGAGISAEAIHGNKSQPQRERALAAFRDGRVKVLVATDIAARGIDVPGVSHVVNYDLPNVPESYVHRIGRTARAGREGIAISFCDGEERAFLRDIERLIRITIPSEDRRPPRREGAPREAGIEGRERGPRENRGEGRGAPRDGRRGPRPEGERPFQRGGERGGFRSERGPREGERQDGSRHDGARHDGARREGHRAEGQRTEGHRADAHRAEGPRRERSRPEGLVRAEGRPDGHRHETKSRHEGGKPRHEGGRHEGQHRDGQHRDGAPREERRPPRRFRPA
ncbi:DEAD/DEAH box helicase [Ancylobacter mangrovi]|uniref:DEAD/DEAH box helicase n=1 Tax=Ancylobacter mangrovi TaxID=2972472 RepID=UPI0021637EF5|nr:DEAD/DEAH box helicase [Ancylobacter mangrovi]MCS0502562.1 DEAD/DEAH box helicase [Ancylobacter mangrovi]